MRSVGPARLALALLALAACGGNDQDKADFNRRKAICDGLVTDPNAPSKTVHEIVPLFDFVTPLGGNPADCQPNAPLRLPPLIAVGADDHCVYDPQVVVCRVLLAYQAVDQSLCNNGGCVYYCELRTSGDINVGANLDAPICARRWVTGQ
jgi:hypothetical protein